MGVVINESSTIKSTKKKKNLLSFSIDALYFWRIAAFCGQSLAPVCVYSSSQY